MAHDYTSIVHTRTQPVVAHRLRANLIAFLHPIAVSLVAQLDSRLVQTFLQLVYVILLHRHRNNGLLLSELGGYLLNPAQAPAGAKRISNLLRAPHWSADMINAFLWQQADARVQELVAAAQQVLLIWDGSVWEKPESQTNPDWCLVRSAKARRLSRRRKGLTRPHQGPPILAPGLHWEGLAVAGMTDAPTIAHMEWWTTRGPHATTQRAVEHALLERSARAWGRLVWHIWDRGYAASAWIQAALTAGVRFVVRWKKGAKLLDNWGEEQAAGAIGRGKRSVAYRYLVDPHTKETIKVGVVAVAVTLPDHPHPLWLIIARLGQGREPWYLLTAEPPTSHARIWQVGDAYIRRWQIEVIWRYSKSELAFESPRVWAWETRRKLLLIAALAYAFLIHLLKTSFAELRAFILRNWCHRTGKRYEDVEMPLYRLRMAISRLWQDMPSPGYHLPLLNSG